MEKLTSKLEQFNQTVVKRIEELMETKGVESQHSSKNVLCVASEDTMFNLDGGRWLIELNQEVLIDNEGYQYDLSVLSLENLCIVIDEIADAITPNFRVVTSDDNGEEVVRYFEDKADGYTEFVKAQCSDKDVRLEERLSDIDRHGMPKYIVINECLTDVDD